MTRGVIDASAVIAFLNNEPGADVVAAYLSDAAMSTVNLAEVVGKMEAVGMPPAELRRALLDCGIVTLPFDDEMAFRAGELKTRTRASGLSLGDCACLALAAGLKVPAVTADRSWAALDLGVEVHLIR